ncbi:putative ABC transport system permease protein [Reichenbachiella faecimaris]|uniref:Putative ABC transport system permease protein n=1 Tax=Reichenbachiella faecimaris TaxID=692418 RepID=A0A1W2GHU9_REIFA|nr:ABC transporter permease [Reichenbachiella faecimaris]SMD36235.1 putative ABC transport system permease protein [Reichenbachiella faecimaris]
MIKKIADRLFKWYCHPDYYPDIQGDLEELHQDQLEQFPKSAELKYLKEVIKLCRPALIRPLFKNSLFNSTGMFKNYFKISFRNLVKQKVFSAINITGLAIGLSAFLLINQYVAFEKSYDQFFTDANQLYRLTTDQVLDGVIGTRDAMSFAPSGAALVEQVPEIINSTLTFQFNELILRKGDRSFIEKRAIAADTNYFELFDYQVLSGDPNTMLTEPNSIILTESRAKAYFGDINPVGQSIMLLGGFHKNFKVTGVIQDIPENTHYKFDLMISISSIEERLKEDDWRSFNYYTYLKLAPQVEIQALRAKLPRMFELSGENESDTDLEFYLQPVEDIHLYSDFTYEPEIHGSANTVIFLNVISILIIIIAWVNYINLSTAKAIDRAREVGVRKAIGAHRIQLVIQFLFESLILNLLAAGFAILIAQLVYPNFNQLVGKDVIGSVWLDQLFLTKVFSFALVGTVVSGLYPAFVLSNFQAVTVLKGKFRNSAKGTFLRKGLVIVQFTVSLMLIAATFIINQQVNYMQSVDKGLDMDFVVGVRRPRYTDDNREAAIENLKQFQQSLLNHHAITDVGFCNTLPGGSSSDIGSTTGEIQIPGKTDIIKGTTYLQRCDENYFDAVGIRLLAGRGFKSELASDTSAIIVNESFMKKLGVQDNESMLNEFIQFGDDEDGRKYRLIGVIADYNRTSLKNTVEPTSTFYHTYAHYAAIKMNQQNYKDGLAHLENTYQSFFPNTPLSYSFLDERFNALFQEDQQFGKVVATFSILAIIVASLGLFGLSAFMAINRAKEVGIRKVLGATIPQILMIFYREFVVLIGLSAVVGIPLVYYTMDGWLDNYAYRVDFPWIFIGMAILLVISSALLTVGYQTIRVAIKNPSETLRYE